MAQSYPNPNPLLTDQSTHHLYPTPYSSSFYYSPNPNPIVTTHASNYSAAAALGSTLNPPGTGPYSSYSHNPVGLYESYAHYHTPDVLATSTVHSSSIAVENWAINELVQYYGTGALQTGPEQLVPPITNPASWTYPAVDNPRGPWKKCPKKINIAQSQFCEVCKITCNTKEVLDKHKMGKKHHKNLELLKAGAAPSATVPNNPVIGPQEKPPGMGNSLSGQKRIKTATAQDLETKRRKIVENGVASSAVKSCGICNVVCNSETVFKTHLVGHKHIAMLKKLTGGKG